ncbi:MAG: hypothetical protein E7Z90_06055 [Cyanobacteria bacterium SIG29]|nr:hypothetical protein [Cyanobacteria bacterium SIG29]
MDIKNLILNYKPKIIHIFVILFLLNLLIFTFFYGKTSLFSDVSRELYIPIAMNNGEVLYKDIFNVYAPLGYQINEIIIKLFSDKINTYFMAGFINSTLILWGLYLLLRIFIKNKPILIYSTLLLITSSCFYTISQTNYIIPYSYSIVYALNFFIWSIVSLLYFFKKEKNIYLYLSFLLFGGSFACKYEFIPIILVLIGTIIYKKIPIKTIIKCILLMTIIPLISLLDLLIKGVRLEHLIESFNYIILLSKAPSVKILYTYLGFIPNTNSITKELINFSIAICYILLFSTVPILFRNKEKPFRLSLIILFLTSIILLKPIFIDSNAFYFNWIGIIAILLFIIFFKKIIENKLLFILYLTTLLCSFKSIFDISFNSYGTYYFPLLFICITILFVHFIKNDKFISILTFLIFTIGSLYLISNIERSNLVYQGKIKNNSEIIYTDEIHSEAINKTVEYINKNTKEEDTILVLPEGSVINYLTKRKSHNKFYYLIPPNIEVFGEESIVKELEQDLPEYLILQPMSYTNFSETYFCDSFGKKICNLIPKYYEAPIVFGDDFWLAIYKLKHDII